MKGFLHCSRVYHLLPASRMYQTVKLLYCFGIFITFALQFYVPAEIFIPPVMARVPDSWKKPVDLLLRTLLVIFTCEYPQEDGFQTLPLLLKERKRQSKLYLRPPWECFMPCNAGPRSRSQTVSLTVVENRANHIGTFMWARGASERARLRLASPPKHFVGSPCWLMVFPCFSRSK